VRGVDYTKLVPYMKTPKSSEHSPIYEPDALCSTPPILKSKKEFL
jgi:hypothetical protein